MDNNQNQPNNSDQTQNPVAGTGNLPPENPAPTNPVTPPATPAPQSTSESPTPNSDSPTPASAPESGGKKKPLGLMIGALLVLLLVFIGLIYYFVLRNPSEPQQPVQQLPVQDLPETTQEVATPTPELTEDTVEDIDIGSPEAALSPIEADLDEL